MAGIEGKDDLRENEREQRAKREFRRKKKDMKNHVKQVTRERMAL